MTLKTLAFLLCNLAYRAAYSPGVYRRIGRDKIRAAWMVEVWLRFGWLSEGAERIARQTKYFVFELSWYDLQAGFGLVVIFSKIGQVSFCKG